MSWYLDEERTFDASDVPMGVFLSGHPRGRHRRGWAGLRRAPVFWDPLLLFRGRLVGERGYC